ncbi:type IV pilus biogenesis/stability protein PilW [Acidihalobacter prosperus]|uniref:Type IV pilus biogenesis/stability protein PilW n=1 Tax=Acidihalobacter prosperus TaxID=160660 RepID=A0A1A6C7U7_9GAMM|nr:type IV pilus biogenesis/stability protein PilW [Acidihalobacter prosperus]OBS10643.1 type IV pilus biogenesis/stability protein PilW [Acidihalobacter prosperus]
MRYGLARIRPFLIITALATLAGCATSPQERKAEAQQHRAAVLNAQLGIDYMQTGNLKLADEKLKRALSQDPNSSVVRNAYALLMQRLGRNDEAEENFSKAVALKPNDGDVHNNFGVFLCEQEHYTRAYAQFKDAWSNPLYNTPEYAYANAGVCAVRQGDKKLAEQRFEQALKVQPGFAPALYQLAKLASEQGDNQKADAYLGRITGEARYTPDILALCLKVKREVGDMNGAADCARDLYRMFPNSPQARALLQNQ